GPVGVAVVEEAERALERGEPLEQCARIAAAVDIEEERAVLALPCHERPAERLARRLDPLLLQRVEPPIGRRIRQLRRLGARVRHLDHEEPRLIGAWLYLADQEHRGDAVLALGVYLV